MIKIFMDDDALKAFSKAGFYPETEGYFVTEQKLRECFEAGGSHFVEENDWNGAGELKNPDFDQWLSNELKGEGDGK